MTVGRAPALLWDARRAAERIVRFAKGRSRDDYLADDLLRSAIERQFEIIGEAFSQLRRFDPDAVVDIPDVPKIVAFRNLIAHGYATINNTTVWDVVQRDLPRLIELLTVKLGEVPPE